MIKWILSDMLHIINFLDHLLDELLVWILILIDVFIISLFQFRKRWNYISKPPICQSCHGIIISADDTGCSLTSVYHSNLSKMISLNEHLICNMDFICLIIPNIDDAIALHYEVHVVWIFTLLHDTFFWLSKAGL